jgi:hypothetical protein
VARPGFPIIADDGLAVSKAFDMLPAEAYLPEGRTPADSQTVRSVFIIGPDKKLKLTMTYPMNVGRNFAEVLRALDGLQTAARENVATPADWVPGQDVVVPVAVSDEDAIAKYGSIDTQASLPADGQAARLTRDWNCRQFQPEEPAFPLRLSARANAGSRACPEARFVKLHDVVIDQPDAARGGRGPDRPGLRRSVDAQHAVRAAPVEVERARTQRVVRPARHAARKLRVEVRLTRIMFAVGVQDGHSTLRLIVKVPGLCRPWRPTATP